MRAWVHVSRRDLAASEQELRDGRAAGALGAELRAVEAMNAILAGRLDEARRLVAESESGPAIGAGGLMLAASAAARLGETERALRFLARPLVRDMAGVLARLEPDLHPLLDREPLAPRRSDLPLVWPLEAPMIDAARHALFREVRIESGLAPGSGTRVT